MTKIELLPPKLKVDINAQIRLRVLSGVLFELTEVCGVHIEGDLKKGIIERDIIEKIIILFQGSNGESYGEIQFSINWEKFELLVKTDDSTELYKGIDFSNGFCNVLDKKLLKVLQVHVNQLKKAYVIKNVKCVFCYRYKYYETEDIFNASKQFMGHSTAEPVNTVSNKQFAKSIETLFKGLDGILSVTFKFD